MLQNSLILRQQMPCICTLKHDCNIDGAYPALADSCEWHSNRNFFASEVVVASEEFVTTEARVQSVCPPDV